MHRSISPFWDDETGYLDEYEDDEFSDFDDDETDIPPFWDVPLDFDSSIPF